MIRFGSFSGRITAISEYPSEQAAGCTKLMTVTASKDDVVNFVVTPKTYIVSHVMLQTGDEVIGFYDADAPAILIYPPQYPAIVMARRSAFSDIKVDYFDDQLISSDGQLKLNIAPLTLVILENGQVFTGDLRNRLLTVVYGATTRSIPAQTTPLKVVVMCRD
jgi:hypothetical protein